MEKNDEILEIKTSTVFADGLVFDFIGDYGEIIIYRPEQQIFTLLDPLHRLQTELSCSEIDSFLANIRDRLLAKKDKFQAFVLNPSFDISASEDESELILQSKWLEYTLKTKLFEEEQLSQAYFLFSNAYCKLNIYLNPGSTTPFARMEVNRILEERSRFPDEFHLTIWPKGKWFLGRTIKIESRHTLVRRLSERDEGRLVRALHFSRQFPKVSFTDYQKSLK
ncbi:MAG: hypothetical protein Q4G68_01120 [Planctomycetia bacterium]|nr:hypothetical protein [Planctomycetia bacterium]